MLDVAQLGAASLVNGVPVWQANVPVANDNDKVEPIGEIEAFQSLGITATPYAKDADGFVECIVARDVCGRTAVALGARDTRNTGFLGRQEGGDVTIHATGPKAVAQCFLKNKKRQSGLATENSKDETMVFVLDGKNDKMQWAGNGAIVEVDKKGDISLVNSSGSGIKIQGGKIYILGELSLPGMTPGMALVQGPPVPYVGGVTPTTMTPVMGVGK
jgi:hypothetical protein